MPSQPKPASPESFETFGDLLHYLRRRLRMTQLDLGIAVGYSEAQISRLEQNKRMPDVTAVAALFMPALDLAEEPQLAARLMELAARARNDGLSTVTVLMTRTVEKFNDELGELEAIPALPPHLVERQALINRLRLRLERERHLALCGLPGSGKTVLAAQLAHEASRHGPVFWLTISAGVSASAEAVLRQLALFLLTLGQESVLPLLPAGRDVSKPLPLERQVAVVCSALDDLSAAGRAPLLCLDNFETARQEEALAALLRRIAAGPARLLLTSSETLFIPGVSVVALRGLEPEEGRLLVAQLAEDLPGGGWVDRLLDKTTNPMLISLAAGQLADQIGDPDSFVASLETQPQVAEYLLRTVQKRLSAAGWCLVSLLSILRQPINLHDDLLVELSQEMKDPCPWRDAIDELQNLHLIESPLRAKLHNVVRDYAYHAQSADPLRRRSFHRVLARWYELCAGDTLEAAFHYARAGELEHVVGVIDGQTDGLYSAGRAAAAVEILEEALQQLSRRRIDNPPLKRRLLLAHGDLLKATLRAGEAEADYRAALTLAGFADSGRRDEKGRLSPGDVPTVRADIVRRLAMSMMQRGQTMEALQQVQSAMASLHPEDAVLQARLAAVECRALTVLSRFDEGERSARKALAWADSFADYLPDIADDVRARAARSLGWIAYTRHPQDPQALEHLRYGLAAARRAGLRVLENGCLSNIATVLVDRGDLAEALKTYEEALLSSEMMGDRYTTSGLLHNLASVNYLRDEIDLAMQRFEAASDLARQLGDWNGLLSSENARGDMLLRLGRVDEAHQALEMTIHTNPELLSDTWTLGSCLCSLAETHALLGRADDADADVRRLLAMEGVGQNARIYTGAQLALVLACLVRQDVAAAQQILDAAPIENLGLELGLKRMLFEALVLDWAGQRRAALAQVKATAAKARPAGYQVHVHTAERMLRTLAEDSSEPLPIQLLYFQPRETRR